MHMVWLGLEWFFGGELGRILGGSNIFFQGGFVFFAVQTDLSAKYKQSKLSKVQPTINQLPIVNVMVQTRERGQWWEFMANMLK